MQALLLLSTALLATASYLPRDELQQQLVAGHAEFNYHQMQERHHGSKLTIELSGPIQKNDSINMSGDYNDADMTEENGAEKDRAQDDGAEDCDDAESDSAEEDTAVDGEVEEDEGEEDEGTAETQDGKSSNNGNNDDIDEAWEASTGPAEPDSTEEDTAGNDAVEEDGGEEDKGTAETQNGNSSSNGNNDDVDEAWEASTGLAEPDSTEEDTAGNDAFEEDGGEEDEGPTVSEYSKSGGNGDDNDGVDGAPEHSTGPGPASDSTEEDTVGNEEDEGGEEVGTAGSENSESSENGNDNNITGNVKADQPTPSESKKGDRGRRYYIPEHYGVKQTDFAVESEGDKDASILKGKQDSVARFSRLHIKKDTTEAEDSTGPGDPAGPEDLTGPEELSGPEDSTGPEDLIGPGDSTGPEESTGPEASQSGKSTDDGNTALGVNTANVTQGVDEDTGDMEDVEDDLARNGLKYTVFELGKGGGKDSASHVDDEGVAQEDGTLGTLASKAKDGKQLAADIAIGAISMQMVHDDGSEENNQKDAKSDKDGESEDTVSEKDDTSSNDSTDEDIAKIEELSSRKNTYTCKQDVPGNIDWSKSTQCPQDKDGGCCDKGNSKSQLIGFLLQFFLGVYGAGLFYYGLNCEGASFACTSFIFCCFAPLLIMVCKTCVDFGKHTAEVIQTTGGCAAFVYVAFVVVSWVLIITKDTLPHDGCPLDCDL